MSRLEVVLPSLRSHTVNMENMEHVRKEGRKDVVTCLECKNMGSKTGYEGTTPNEKYFDFLF